MSNPQLCPNPETRLETDIMILDYVLCRAIQGILTERMAQRNGHTTSDNDCESLIGIFDGQSIKTFFSLIIIIIRAIERSRATRWSFQPPHPLFFFLPCPTIQYY